MRHVSSIFLDFFAALLGSDPPLCVHAGYIHQTSWAARKTPRRTLSLSRSLPRRRLTPLASCVLRAPLWWNPSLDASLLSRLRALATDAAGQLDVLGHDGDALGVDGVEAGVFEEAHQSP